MNKSGKAICGKISAGKFLQPSFSSTIVVINRIGGKMDFSGKVVLVTGASSGIGLAIAREFVSRDAIVYLAARRYEILQDAIASIPEFSNGKKIGVCCFDVREPVQARQMVEQVIEEVGLPDILINSVGAAHPGFIQDLELEIFEWMMQTNYFGVVHTVRAVLPQMMQRGSGVIVNVASLAAYIGVIGYSAYGASKFALRGYTEALRMEAKPYGIKVSIVLPPDTDTPQLAYENRFKPLELKYLFPELGVIPPEQVARAVIKGIEHGKYEIIADTGTKLILMAYRPAGQLVFSILDWLLNRAKARIRREQSK
jgi:3-dehydrosphinganine reductase